MHRESRLPIGRSSGVTDFSPYAHLLTLKASLTISRGQEGTKMHGSVGATTTTCVDDRQQELCVRRQNADIDVSRMCECD